MVFSSIVTLPDFPKPHLWVIWAIFKHHFLQFYEILKCFQEWQLHCTTFLQWVCMHTIKVYNIHHWNWKNILIDGEAGTGMKQERYLRGGKFTSRRIFSRGDKCYFPMQPCNYCDWNHNHSDIGDIMPPSFLGHRWLDQTRKTAPAKAIIFSFLGFWDWDSCYMYKTVISTFWWYILISKKV